MHSNSLNPLKHPIPIKSAEREREVALIAVGAAIRSAHAARSALLRRHTPSAQRFAGQATEALAVIISGARP